MANWYGTSRSNYFKVKDNDAFVEALNLTGIEHTFSKDDNTFMVQGGDEGYWPASYFDEDADDDIEFDIIQVIQAHLADDEVCVLMSAGAEKLRYVTGDAQAFTNKKVISISINEIYAKAAKRFKVPLSKISVAEY